ncbi:MULTISPECIES: potassium-transporting ATPase subunit KdpC [Burkholderia]|uniref:Potassium-transporting ATPase KdpC subunit n=1 Tax=Burkholderia savannae TaxID=1637837 RepID=A0ABR5TBI5_9BURK|nr:MULTISPECIES: potassium-transporting ATPase subunit KdpC [Burkholderia]AOJ80116.1 potassium-transporting ATPase subunit C [Burkholderia savannae]KGR98109.1 K+-transporting ATPase, C subunit [Burkholderia sp. ABCPW 111]KVK75786.1 potassium-transporting ATPase subunit C [Burkholderia sp. MSMB1498]KWZ42320.1 potassium-transporting ATPase subunit C [Burkholderia savannae]KWZ45397.1 potassium-transporting ATPase subunit C [Burkholderia savannae]
MKTLIRPVLVLFAALTLITGGLYPLVVTGIGQAVFPWQANGSLLTRDARAIGSAVIGQQFDAPQYFWGRLSATTPNPYNAQGSNGSNLGPTNPALAEEAKGRIDALKAAGTDVSKPIPVDLVTSSGSGLDPEITPAAAAYQAERVAKARGLSVDQVSRLIAGGTSGRQLGVLGEPRVNVLKLNLALDEAKPMR